VQNVVIDKVVKEAYPRERKVSGSRTFNGSFSFRWVET